MINHAIPVLGFAAFSGTGKTTLLEQLIPLLKQAGIRVALIKHAHHDVDVDTPGKDTWRLRHAGANPVLLATRKRWALMGEEEDDYEDPQLARIVTQLNPAIFNLILVEGFKHEAIQKIELHRQTLNKPYIYPEDPLIIALAHDSTHIEKLNIPQLDLNKADGFVTFIQQWLSQRENYE